MIIPFNNLIVGGSTMPKTINSINTDLKPITTTRVINHLKEWHNYNAIKKASSDNNHYYFTAKTYPMKEEKHIKVNIYPEKDGSFNIFEREHNNKVIIWEWLDCITD
jgi:hypothetical protein